MTVSEKVAYIRGLYDGLGLDGEKSGEARILSELLDVLREVGLQMDGMDATLDQFDKELDTLEDTVAGLEDAVFDGEVLAVDDEALAAGVVDCPACGGKFALSFDDENKAGRDE